MHPWFAERLADTRHARDVIEAERAVERRSRPPLRGSRAVDDLFAPGPSTATAVLAAVITFSVIVVLVLSVPPR